MKMQRNLTEKLRKKLPMTMRGHSIVKFTNLDDALSEILKLKASIVEG